MKADVVKIFEAGDYERHIGRAAGMLREGGVVVLPTETVYGAAARLNIDKGRSRLRALPPAAQGKPLVIHLADPTHASRYIGPINGLGQRMIRKLWPGPVAMIFTVPAQRQRVVAGELGLGAEELYENDTIILRCPDHIVTQDILRQADGPVVLRRAGGAEQSAAPATIAQEWGEQIELLIDAGPTQYSKPSTMVKVSDDSYEVVRSGVYDQRIIERLLRTTILFVCSGNTCRSPMAEVIARQLLARKLNITEAELDKQGITVISAGSFAMPGARAAAPAIEALKGTGADLSRHRSRPLTVELIHQADVIYTMSRNHSQAVVGLVPAAADKVHTLDPDRDIEDPIGGDVALYQSLAGQLERLIGKRLSERPLF